MRKTIFTAAAAIMCAVTPPQLFAQSSGQLTGGTNNTTLQAGTQAGFLAGTIGPKQTKVLQAPITVNIANDRHDGETFDLVIPQHGYGGGPATPGISGYSYSYAINNPTYTSAIVKVHRFKPGSVTPKKDYVDIEELYTGRDAVGLQKPIKIFLDIPTARTTIDAAPLPQQPSSALPYLPNRPPPIGGCGITVRC